MNYIAYSQQQTTHDRVKNNDRCPFPCPRRLLHHSSLLLPYPHPCHSREQLLGILVLFIIIYFHRKVLVVSVAAALLL